MMKRVPIVFASADASRTLSLDEDLRRIKEKVRAARYRDVLDFNVCPAARLDDLVQALYESPPQIVHFSGHGGLEGLRFVAPDGIRAEWVNADDLEELFAAFRGDIRIVVLSACSTGPQAEAIANIVGCAIGTPASIADEAAIVFNAEFYRAIAFGESAQGAYDKACAVLRAKKLDEVRPELWVGPGVDPRRLVLVPKPGVQTLRRRVASTAAMLVLGSGAAVGAAQVLDGPRIETSGENEGPVKGNSAHFEALREFYREGNHAATFSQDSQAAEAGNPEAMGLTGIAYLLGEGPRRDPELAEHWLRKAAGKRDAWGMNGLAVAYEDGIGVRQSFHWAQHWYKAAATETSLAEAMRNLARHSREGLGSTVRSDSVALAWYLMAVNAGSVDAITDIGLMYAEGVHGRADVDKAMAWLKRGAREQSPRAMHAIGRVLENSKRYAAALVWYDRAAKAGSAEAMNNIGVLYQNGWGVPADREEAERWFRRAAEAGSPAAPGHLAALEAS